jgi:hypothetical protein
MIYHQLISTLYLLFNINVIVTMIRAIFIQLRRYFEYFSQAAKLRR